MLFLYWKKWNKMDKKNNNGILIKHHLNLNNMRVIDLAEKTGISKEIIFSIIRGDSKKEAHIQKIFAALNIPNDDLSSIDFIGDNDNILDTKKMNLAFKIILDVLEANNIAPKQKKFFILYNKVYQYIDSVSQDENSIKGYIYGLIENKRNI
jgi:predicted transcriptional regulator